MNNIILVLIYVHGWSEEQNGGTCTCTYFASPIVDNCKENFYLDYKASAVYNAQTSFALSDLQYTNCIAFFYGDHYPKQIRDWTYVNGTIRKVLTVGVKPFSFLQIRHARPDAGISNLYKKKCIKKNFKVFMKF